MRVLNPNVQRIDRRYFWIAWFAVDFVECILLDVGFALWEIYESNALALGLVCLSIFFLVYNILLNIKRFHDVGHSASYYFLCLVLTFVLVGIVMWFLVVIKSSGFDNEWGESPEW